MHLKVSDLDRSVAFYRDVLGMELQQFFGNSAAFMSYGGYHHHLGLNIWESRGGPPPARGMTGLFHVAILYPTRKALAQAFRRVLDHGYLHDPDQNGLELYWDRPESEWPRVNGELRMVTDPLDLDDLLAEADR